MCSGGKAYQLSHLLELSTPKQLDLELFVHKGSFNVQAAWGWCSVIEADRKELQIFHTPPTTWRFIDAWMQWNEWKIIVVQQITDCRFLMFIEHRFQSKNFDTKSHSTATHKSWRLSRFSFCSLTHQYPFAISIAESDKEEVRTFSSPTYELELKLFLDCRSRIVRHTRSSHNRRICATNNLIKMLLPLSPELIFSVYEKSFFICSWAQLFFSSSRHRHAWYEEADKFSFV